MAAKINLADLKKQIADAERTAQLLVADARHGRSHFVAGLRGNLSAAVLLVEEHEKWTVANPETPEPPKAST